MAFFVAFYSYKGGVGRSLALANVAYLLAARGKRVVLLDLDLEAPGLQDIPEFALKRGAKRGFLEYAAAFHRTGRCPDISRYVHPCRESPGTGKLWLMPSGNLGFSYQEQLGSLSWKRLHLKKGTEPFVEELRSALVQGFSPDFVLIDSRTGLSDIGGLTTHRLADMVVLVFNLSRPSIEGSIRAYRSFTSKGSLVKTVQLVASPVPPLIPGAQSITERRLDQAKELMPMDTASGGKLIRIAYDPSIVFSEELSVRRPEAYASATQYEGLTEAIQRAKNPIRRALLIGIARYPKFNARRALGSVNDVSLIEYMLSHAGFPREHIRKLIDEEATREGILEALTLLTSQTQEGDIVFIFYSGFGSQMTDREGDEPDGLDETIVPYDSGRDPNPNRDITDDELYLFLQELTQRTSHLTVVFDCSHSGTMTSDPLQVQGRFVDPELRPSEELPPSSLEWVPLEDSGSLGPSGWFPVSQRHTFIAACRSDERSYEIQVRPGLFQGALTYFLVQVILETGSANISEIFGEVVSRVSKLFPQQHPQLEGISDGELLGPRATLRGRKLLVVTKDRDEASITLRTTSQTYPETGVTYSIYLPLPPSDDRYLGKVEVVNVMEGQIQCRIISEISSGAIGSQSQVILDLESEAHM